MVELGKDDSKNEQAMIGLLPIGPMHVGQCITDCRRHFQDSLSPKTLLSADGSMPVSVASGGQQYA